MTRPFGEAPPEAAYLILDSCFSHDRLARWLAKFLPRLNWQSHLFVLGETGAVSCEAAEEFAVFAADHLRDCKLASIIFHPVV